MKHSQKRVLSALLLLALLFTSLPLPAFSAPEKALRVTYLPTMTVEELTAQINSAAGLKDASPSEWQYETTADVKYTYTRIEAYVGMMGYGWENITNEVRSRPQLDEIAKTEAEKRAKNDIPSSTAFVPITGTVKSINEFSYSLPDPVVMPDNYKQAIMEEYGVEVESFPARSMLKGTWTYPALSAADLGEETLSMQCRGVSYSVTFKPATEVHLAALGNGVFSFKANGLTQAQYDSLVLSGVIDMNRSTLGEEYDPSRLSVTYLDRASGKYVPNDSLTLSLGTYYEAKLFYDGKYYDDTLSFLVVFTDAREMPGMALSDGRLETVYTSDPAQMKKKLTDTLLTFGKNAPDAAAIEFSYEIDYQPALLTGAAKSPLLSGLRTALGDAYQAGGWAGKTGVSVSDFKASLTDAKLTEALSYRGFVPIGGGSFDLTFTVGGKPVTLGQVALPAIGVGTYRIRAVFAGTTTLFPLTLTSEEAVVTVRPAPGDLTKNASVSVLSFAADGKNSLTLSDSVRNSFVFSVGGIRKLDAGTVLESVLSSSATLGALCDNVLPLLGVDSGMQKHLTSMVGTTARGYAFSSSAVSPVFSLRLITDPNYLSDFEAVGGKSEKTVCAGLAGGAFVLTESPDAGQYWKITSQGSERMTVDLTRTAFGAVKSPVDFDGKAHGAPVFTAGSAASGDSVLYVNCETGLTSAAAPSNAGTYYVRYLGKGSKGFTAEHSSYRFTVSRITVPVTLQDVNVLYGEDIPTLTPVFGTMPEDPTLSYRVIPTGYEGKCGTYPLSLEITSQNPSYELKIERAGALTVKQNELTVKIDDKSLTYGDPFALSFTVKSGKLTHPDRLPLTYSETPVHAGTYNVTATCSDPGFLVHVQSGTVKIAQKTLTLTINPLTIRYGTTPYFSTTPDFSDPYTKLSFNVEDYDGGIGDYTVTASLADARDYNLTVKPGKLTIEKCCVFVRADDVTVLWGDPLPKTFEAHAYLDSTYVGNPAEEGAYGDRIEAPELKMTVTCDVPDNPEVGDYPIRVTVTDTSGGKYDVTTDNLNAKLHIVKRKCAVGLSPAALEYGQTGYKAEDHLVKGEVPKGVTFSFNVPEYHDAGTYTVGITAKGSYDTAHYELLLMEGTLTVLPKEITVKADTLTKFVGKKDPPLTYKVRGLISGDKLSGAPSRAPGEEVGSYIISQGTLSNDNYAISFTPGALLILSAEVDRLIVSHQPNKTEYPLGASLDTTGLEVRLLCKDGSSVTLPDGGWTITGFSSQTAGTKTVTVVFDVLSATFPVHVGSGGFTLKKSDVIRLDGEILYVTGKGKAVPLSQLVSLSDSVFSLKASTSAGKTVQTTDPLSTGTTVKVYESDVLLCTLTVCTAGDVNGDGTATLTDLLQIKSHLLKKTTLTGLTGKAADFSGDGAISVTDFVQVKAVLLGKG